MPWFNGIFTFSIIIFLNKIYLYGKLTQCDTCPGQKHLRNSWKRNQGVLNLYCISAAIQILLKWDLPEASEYMWLSQPSAWFNKHWGFTKNFTFYTHVDYFTLYKFLKDLSVHRIRFSNVLNQEIFFYRLLLLVS